VCTFKIAFAEALLNMKIMKIGALKVHIFNLGLNPRAHRPLLSALRPALLLYSQQKTDYDKTTASVERENDTD